MGCARDAESIDYDEALARLGKVVDCNRAASQSIQGSGLSGTRADPDRYADERLTAQDENIPFAGVVGKRCTVTVFAPFDTPAVDSSAMDGYAVCSAFTAHASASRRIKFRVIGTIAAGDQCWRTAQDNDMHAKDSTPICVEIMTGAPFPERTHPHLDCVVKVEDVVEHTSTPISSGGLRERYIEIRSPVAAGQHRRPAGTDFRKGDRIVSAGETIEARHVMALASLGYSTVGVVPQMSSNQGMINSFTPLARCPALKVGILSTGSELVDTRSPQGEFIGNRQLYDSNGPYLIHALCERHAVDVRYLGTVADEIELIQQRVENAVDNLGLEILIITGGVSKGRFDFTRQIIEDCFGGEVIFHGVKIRPGAPVLLATVERHFDNSSSRPHKTTIFGLPGNPLAAAAGLQFFVRPYLDSFGARIAGTVPSQNCCTRPDLSTMSVARMIMSSSKGKTKPAALVAFWLGRRYKEPDTNGREMLVAEVFDDQASYKTNVLAKSNCWVIVPAGVGTVLDGCLLDTVPL